MNITIANCDSRLEQDARPLIEQRLYSGLRPFERKIATASVSFEDTSGPYGADKQCSLRLVLNPGGELNIQRRGASARLALGRVVETAMRELRRRFKNP